MPDSARTDAMLRRYAIQIAQQLPENRDDALRILEHIRGLIEWEHEPGKADNVREIRRGA